MLKLSVEQVKELARFYGFRTMSLEIGNRESIPVIQSCGDNFYVEFERIANELVDLRNQVEDLQLALNQERTLNESAKH